MIKETNINIWGRDFLLPVRFDCYTGEEVTNQQIDAMNLVIKNPKWIEKAKSIMEKYCKKAVDSDNANLKKDNVFSYVKPEYFYVKRDEGKAIFNKDYTIYEGEADNQFYFEAGNASNNTIKIDFIEMSRVTLKSFNKICYVITIIN